ncbi:MAG: VWA domain-containing protein [archaeon]
MIFTFTHAQYLFLLFLIPLLFLIHFFSLSNKKRIALKFANFDAIGRIKGIDFFSKNIVNLFLNSIIIFLMILSVSGLTVQVFKSSSSFSYVIAMDISQSMEADDFYPNRATVAKEIATDFVEWVPVGTRIGIVSFSGNAYIEQDMSEDKITIKNSIKSIEIDGWGGTDLFEAVITSANLLMNEEHRAIVLLSDGQINVGKIEDMVSYAQKNEIIIHSIAIGTKDGGKTSYAISKLDEEFLQSVSYNTGGKYFLVENRTQLSDAFSNVLEETNKKVSIGLSDYLILFAIILFAIEFFLVNTRYLNIL